MNFLNGSHNIDHMYIPSIRTNNDPIYTVNQTRDQFYLRKFKLLNMLLIFLYLVILISMFLVKKGYDSFSWQSHLGNLTDIQKVSKFRMLNNSLDLSFINETISNENRKHVLLVESFFFIIANKEYEGTWNSNNNMNENSNENLNFTPYYDFRKREGTFKLKISTSKAQEMYIGTTDARSIILDIEIRDGKYKDRYILLKQEFTYYFDYNRYFMNTVNITFDFTDLKRIQITNKNEKKLTCLESVYDLFQLIDNRITYSDQLNITFLPPNYNRIEGNLNFNQNSFSLQFYANEKYETFFDRKVYNFTIILTFLGMLSMYSSVLVIKEVIVGRINANSFSSLFISSNLIYNAIVSISSFYISITYPNYFSDFSLPSIVFFMDFSIFQIRFLFIIWRFRNDSENDVQENLELQRKIYKFYLILYLCLFLNLLMIYYIFLYKWVLFTIASIGFFPQIIHNCRVNITRNKIPYKLVFIVTLNRLFLPLYLRLCPNNYFETEPDFLFSYLLLTIYAVQIVFLFLQAKFGALFFIPKNWRPGYFNYYKSIDEIKLDIKDLDANNCAICLGSFNICRETVEMASKNASQDDLLVKIQVSEEASSLSNSSDSTWVSKKSCKEKFTSCFRKHRGNILMMTPCKHVFHPDCLKIWGERKNKCPVCRMDIPCIE